MPSHYDLSDEKFESQFKNLTLDPRLFDHEAHLRLGWIHIRKYGLALAQSALCAQINIFDSTFDEGTRFNASLTNAALQVLSNHMQQEQGVHFSDFMKAHPNLQSNFKELVNAELAAT